MGIDLYYSEMSPDSQSALMTVQFLGIDVNKKAINFRLGEQRTPEFLKMNPQHCVPTMVDDGFVLWESRAIMMYLASKYDKTGKLYPTDDLKKRALVDRQLYFNGCSLLAKFQNHYMFTVKAGLPVDQKKFTQMVEAVSFLDKDLEGNVFVTGEDLTIADICHLSAMYNYKAAGFPVEDYKNITRWMEKCASLGLKYPENVMTVLKGFLAPK